MVGRVGTLLVFEILMTQASATVQASIIQTSKEVLELLQEQAALYERLEMLAGKQGAMATQDDPEPLARILAARQEVTEALVRVGDTLAPVRRNWASFRGRMAPDQQRNAEELWQRIPVHLSRVRQRDEQDIRLLSARKQIVQGMLKSTHVTKQALSAYRVRMPKPTRVIHVDEDS